MVYKSKESNSNGNDDENNDTDYRNMLEEDHRILEYTIGDIEEYIDQIKILVGKGKYDVPQQANRAENKKFIQRYRLRMRDIENILNSLNVYDFCYGTRNRNKGFEKEILYVFSKEYEDTFPEGHKRIHIYIKMNLIKPNDNFVIVISFHEDTAPMKPLFERE